MHLAATALAAVVLAASSNGIQFKGLKTDPMICTGEGDLESCCGYLAKSGSEVKCKGPQYLHPAMRPVAECLTKALQVTSNPEACEQGLRETFRGKKLQDSYKSIPGNWSFHNWGLAIDVCSYFKSGDCSQQNLINKVLGGVFTWKVGGKIRCQAEYRKKGVSGPSKDVVAKVLANPHYAQTQAAVKQCYADSGVPYGDSNWGGLWTDYFDGPHFQYLASTSAGYYKKKKAKTGPHVFAKLLEDCYEGDRMSMLTDLYAQDDPVEFIRSRRQGCGTEANDLFDEYLEKSYPDGF
jgi:hypothetical protein